GPSLDGLFFQSNFGIVTRAAVELVPRQPFHAVLGCTVDSDEKLPLLVDAVAGLIRQEALPASAHLANRARSRSVLGGILAQRRPDGEVKDFLDQKVRGAWALSCPLAGEPGQVRLAYRACRRALGRLGTVTLTTDRGLERGKAWCRRLSFLPWARRR